MASPVTSTFNLRIIATHPANNVTIKFETKVGGNDTVVVLDHRVCAALSIDEDTHHKYVVDYKYKHPPREVKRDNCVYIHELNIENNSVLYAVPRKLSFSKCVSVGVGSTRRAAIEANALIPYTKCAHVRRVGSTRRAAIEANALIPAGNRAIDVQEKAEADEKKKKRENQKKRKAREAIQPAVKKPEFKGEGRKLNDPAAAELLEKGKDEEALMDGVGESVAKPVSGLDEILDKHVKDLGLKESEDILIRKKLKGKIGNKAQTKLLDALFKRGSNMHRLIREDMREQRQHMSDINFAQAAYACVNNGSYEFYRLSMQETRQQHGQMLSDSRQAEDDSDTVQVEIHLGASAIGNGNNAYEAIDFDLITREELPDFIGHVHHCCEVQDDWRVLTPPHHYAILNWNCLFWSVIYHVQREVPKTGRRLHYAEMLQQIRPDINWDYLLPDRKTRASKEKY